MPQPTLDELIQWLPEGLIDDPDALDFVRNLLGPLWVARDYMVRKAEALPELHDPQLIPDALVPLLAAGVGLGADVPAVASAGIDDLRQLIGVAVQLWKVKGTRPSWRKLTAQLAASRALILHWHDTRIVAGSWGWLWLMPRQGTTPGSSYDNPEHVTDVWFMDPLGVADVPLLAAFLNEFRGNGERINLLEALLVDDLLAGAVLWAPTVTVPGGGGYQAATHEITVAAGELRSADVGGAEAAWTDYHAVFRLAFNDDAYVHVLQTNDGDDAYKILVQAEDTPGTSRKVGIFRRVGGFDSLLASAFWSMQPDQPYMIAVSVHALAAATEISVRIEGALVAAYSDAHASRHTAGTVAFSAPTGAGDTAALSNALVFQDKEPGDNVRVGPTP